MLTTMLKGLPLSEAEALGDDALVKKLGISLSAVRLKCALLPLHVMRLAVREMKAAST